MRFYTILWLICATSIMCFEEECDRRPLGTKTDPLPSDNQFKIDVLGAIDEQYIPDRTYTVSLHAQDNKATFIAFTISAREDTRPNEKNPRRPILLHPGIILPSPESKGTKSSPNCNNTVIQSNIKPKTSVNVTWIAPPKENRCVTIYALLAVKPDVWYSYEGPLSKKICEDRRKSDDMKPMVNDNCQMCEDARYMLTFEGSWSYNTHPFMYPKTPEVARFSDLVGASHNNGFVVWKFNGDASQGLKMLAEQGNTTKLELEIQNDDPESVRTLIKATGQAKPNMTTTAQFRVTREHHLVSLVTAIQPSPDWFLGVANLELCEVTTGPPRWVPSLRLNLYPMDAGTDSGVEFEAPNEETLPPQPISTAIINKDVLKEDIKPFGILYFNLIRTYKVNNCVTEANVVIDSDATSESSFNYNSPQATSESPPETDPESPDDCPLTPWNDWLQCEGECVDGKLDGYQTRIRYHIVDQTVVGLYNEKNSPSDDLEVSEYCLDNYPVTETRECSASCDNTVTPIDELDRNTLTPGQTWKS